jgi:hypothetical protein
MPTIPFDEGYTLLEKLATIWGTIQEENTAERPLVTDREWATWQDVNRSISASLTRAIDELTDHGCIATATLQRMEGHLRSIESSVQVPASKLKRIRNSPRRAEKLQELFDAAH